MNYFRNVEDVHSMMDDIAESQDLSKEISEAISNPVGIGINIDEVKIKIKYISLLEHTYI